VRIGTAAIPDEQVPERREIARDVGTVFQTWDAEELDKALQKVAAAEIAG